MQYFLDLMVMITEGNDRIQLQKSIRDALRKHQKDQDYIESIPIGKQLKEGALDMIPAIISDSITTLGTGMSSKTLTCVVAICKNVINAIINEGACNNG